MNIALALGATSGIDKYIDYVSILKILAVGLIAGAALTAVFAFGLVLVGMSEPATNLDGPTAVRTRSYPALIGAGLCFLIVLGAAGYGVNVIVSK
jgi:hypothetical protein